MIVYHANVSEDITVHAESEEEAMMKLKTLFGGGKLLGRDIKTEIFDKEEE